MSEGFRQWASKAVARNQEQCLNLTPLLENADPNTGRVVRYLGVGERTVLVDTITGMPEPDMPPSHRRCNHDDLPEGYPKVGCPIDIILPCVEEAFGYTYTIAAKCAGGGGEIRIYAKEEYNIVPGNELFALTGNGQRVQFLSEHEGWSRNTDVEVTP